MAALELDALHVTGLDTGVDYSVSVTRTGVCTAVLGRPDRDVLQVFFGLVRSAQVMDTIG